MIKNNIDISLQPIILMNIFGHVTYYNFAMRKFLFESNIVAIQEQFLYLPEPYQSQIHEILKKVKDLWVLNPSFVRQMVETICMTIPHHKEQELCLFISILVSNQDGDVFDTFPMLLIIFSSPNNLQLANVHSLKIVFGLTLAESRVALALLDGLSPKEIAYKHQVNLDTIRKQLQAIYKKTATKRQSDLVKLLLNMPRHSEY